MRNLELDFRLLPFLDVEALRKDLAVGQLRLDHVPVWRQVLQLLDGKVAPVVDEWHDDVPDEAAPAVLALAVNAGGYAIGGARLVVQQCLCGDLDAHGVFSTLISTSW